MDATTAMQQTNALFTSMIASLTPEHREMSTPCDQWTVHDLLGHVCGGAQMIAGGLQDQVPPEEPPDYLAGGPVAGWTDARTALEAAATPEALAASHQMPFGEVPGEMALAVISADILTHAWDLAQATGISHGISDGLAEFALQAWMPLVPAEGRTGDGFKAAVSVAADASPVDRLVGYTGRTPLS